ncbi:Gfo/Idh/MocA family oxidoreductase [Tamlana fucoidanivorans]|uniref:Gfo/Idh/MocA family oxidoreductase n=1 Tax=Allotamlana fucoidanivorans TaxID=2583814 RepID=A0A5C4SNC2_9FLAO|nr:Gfo/Idh/MocA family oxidoreductase [Tamlana fucoidanivorans]TNJ44902.1 Gfo/Idh/MocA family oxidoreductase [Tamlana fucoidanivorans]
MSTNRRSFIKKAAAGVAGVAIAGKFESHAMSAKSYSNIIGANDRINVAIQGLGRRCPAYKTPIVTKENNVKLLYLCDVMKSQRERAAKDFGSVLNYKVALENDIRKVLEDKDVDAVFMATPDHWHTPGACMAMQAGKHVYLEKPCSHNMFENELVVAAQKKYGKVVQMGNQQRSSLESNTIIKDIHEGIIGKIYKATAFYINKRGRVPNQTKTAPPEGLDWDLFQGPAPRRDYTDNTWNYNWHWYGWDYGTAEMGNNATHELDIARWALGVKYPMHVNVRAGKNQFLDDGWEMYDSMEARFTFSDGQVIEWDGQSRNNYNKYGKGRGTIVYGSEGSAFLDREGFALYNLAGELIRDSKSGGSEGGMALGGGGDLTTSHAKNFFQTIRGKEELASPIAQGALSQALTHYANIASRINKPFDVDTNSGRIFDREAMALWSRTYEPGWEPKL